MIDLSCLDRPPSPAADRLFSDGVFDATAGLLLVAVGLAAATGPWMRRRYRWRVIRLMRLDRVGAAPPAAAAPRAAGRAPASRDASGFAAAARRLERRITYATFAAWLVFGLTGLLVAGWVEAGSGLAGRVIFAAAAAVLALGPTLTNLPPRWTKRPLAIGFASCVLGMVLMFSLGEGGFLSGTGTDDDELAGWEMALGGLGVGAAYLVMFHRSVRGYVLPLLVVLAIAMAMIMIPFDLVQDHVGACLMEDSPLQIVGVTTLVVIGVWAGLEVLGALARLVERGWLSEVSVASAAGLLVVALALVSAQIPDADDGRSAWLSWLPLAWWAASLGAYVMVATGRRRDIASGPQLLVLRVFAREARKHALLDRLQSRWRYLGPVHQIGGPDMVDMNIEPHEGAMFLRGRLHELFVSDPTDVAHLQQRLRTTPDREGRYGINEVFCFNSAWRATVEQLMYLSDAVLLDLRGLTAQREGTGYEIRRLAGAALLSRAVAVGDETTDWAYVDILLRGEGQDPEQLIRVDAVRDPQGEDLFAQLLRAASGSWPDAGGQLTTGGPARDVARASR